MKCIMNTDGKVIRIKDGVAHHMVREGGWMYCPKSKWKEQEREGV